MLPTVTLTHKEEKKASGFKKEKQSLTVMAYSNASRCHRPMGKT